VSGGQPGVFYHFRHGQDATELGLPAYSHKLDDTDPTQNKGLGQVRVEIDVVVARDPSMAPGGDLPQVHPQLPLVEIAPLPADGNLTVMAVKARSSLSWSASRIIATTAAPPSGT